MKEKNSCLINNVFTFVESDEFPMGCYNMSGTAVWLLFIDNEHLYEYHKLRLCVVNDGVFGIETE